MKKVLMVLYWFPPAVGAAIKRGSKFCKYMNDFGYKPYVIAGEPTKNEIKDISLLKEFEGLDIEIHRVKKHDLSGINYDLRANNYSKKKSKMFTLLKTVLRNMVIPDKAVFWGIGSIGKAVRIVKREKIEVVFTTFAPGTSHVIGLILKKRFRKIRWIADFRDSWMMDPTLKRRFVNKLANAPLERSTLKNCDQAIFVNSIIERKYINRYKFLDGKTSVITNGFDIEDISSITESVKNENTDRRIIIHAGTLSPSRTPDSLLKSIMYYNEDENNKRKLKFLSVGIFYSNLPDDEVQTLIDNDYLEIVQFMDKMSLAKLYDKSEVISVLINQSPGAEEIVTGKLFEAISLRKKLLLLGPVHGEAARIVEETKSGVVGDFLSQSDINNAVKETLAIEDPGYDEIEIKKYFSKNLTMGLCEILDGKVSVKDK